MNKQEIEKKLRLLLRSVYLKGQMDKTTDLSWEDKIIEDIFALLQSGDNIGKCKVCGNVLQKEGCPICHECNDKEVVADILRMENKKLGGMLSDICKLLRKSVAEKKYFDEADILSRPPSPCGEFNSMAELKRKWIEATQRIDDLAREKSRMSTYIREQADEIKRYREACESFMKEWENPKSMCNPDTFVSNLYDNNVIDKMRTALETGKEAR